MTWLKLSTAMPNDAEIWSLSDQSWRLYVSALCYAQEQFSDGFVPENQIKRLSPTAKPRHLKELCETRSGGGESLLKKAVVNGVSGYMIRNFTRYNATATDRRRELEATAERVRRWRAKNRGKDAEP